MKNLKKILVCLLFIIAFTACESEVTIDDPKSESTEEVMTKTGNQNSGEDDERDNG